MSPAGIATATRALRILIVEDDRPTAEALEEALAGEGHRTVVAHDGRQGLELAAAGGHDLVLVDLVLPGLDGYDLIARLRADGQRVPVIAISGRARVEDRVAGLDAGADDYLVKPFSLVELLARIRALQRRALGAGGREVRAGDLRLDRLERRVAYGDLSVELTNREFQLLDYLMHHPGEVLPRSTISRGVWQLPDTGTNVIDVYVTYLRRKLGPVLGECIRTVRGVGYRFDPPPARATPGRRER